MSQLVCLITWRRCLPAIILFLLQCIPLQAQEEVSAPFGENGEVYVLINAGAAGGVWAMNNLTAGTRGLGVPECLFDPTGDPDTSIRGLKVDPARMVYFFQVVRDADFIRLNGNIRVRINTASPHRGHRRMTHEWHDLTEKNHYGHFSPTEHPLNSERWRLGTGARIPAVPASMLTGYVPFGYSPIDSSAPDCSSDWYWVPNPSAYHSFVRSITSKKIGKQLRTNMEDGVGDSDTSYYIFGETHYNRRNQYYLMDWQDILDDREMNFSRQDELLGTGSLKAETRDLHISRTHVNGCHDGCTGGNNSSEYTSTPWLADVVMSMSGNDYLYKRQVGMTNGIIVKNGGSGSMPEGTVIGYPEDLSTEFLAVSSRDHQTEWVYLLGARLIREWMIESGMNAGVITIDEVVVSDQWWQDGGIVFALDKQNGRVYKFRRDERIQDHGFPEEIPVPRETDSIGSDGYGNLYYAVPRNKPPVPESFKTDYSFNGGDIESITWNQVEPGVFSGTAIFRQEVSKVIYRFGYLSRSESVVGSLGVGHNEYTRPLMAVGVPAGAHPDFHPETWEWVGSYYLVGSGNGPVRTEITSVNYAAPPKVNGYQPARLDIAGPFYADPLTGEIRPFEVVVWNGYREGELYLFGVENFAVPDLNVENERYADRALNIKSGEGSEGIGLENESLSHCLELPVDNDDDGVIRGTLDYYNRKVGSGGAVADWKGGFPSTLDFTTLRYRWSIYQYRDRHGIDVTGDRNGDGRPDGPRVIYDNSLNSAVDYGWQKWPYLGLCLDGGEYELRLEARYRWFNYDVLPKGSLAGDRYTHPGVYVPPADQPAEWGVAVDGTNIARYRFHVKTDGALLPEQPGRIVCLGIEPLPGESLPPEPLFAGGSWVINEDRRVLWELREAEGVPSDQNRINLMLQDRPPVPEGLDPAKVIGLEWQGGIRLQFSVELLYPLSPPGPLAGEPAIPTVSLTRESPDDGALPPAQRRPMAERLADLQLKTGANDTYSAFNEATIFATPSDPYRYRVTMRATRLYSYQAYVSVDTNPPYGPRVQQVLSYAGKIDIQAVEEVMVRDTTPPAVMVSIPGNPVSSGGIYRIFAATGGRLRQVAAEVDHRYPPPEDNPDYMEVYIEDNNPFGSYPGSAEGGFANQGLASHGGITESNSAAVRRRSAEWTRGRYSNLHTQERYARMSFEACAVIEGVPEGETTPVKTTQRHELPTLEVAESDEEQFDSRFTGTSIQVTDEFSGDPFFLPSEGMGTSVALYTIDPMSLYPVSQRPVEGMTDLNGCPVYEWTDRFSSEYATNHPGWQAPAVFTSFSDSSGNTLNNVKMAEILIRDNIQPNPIIELEIVRRRVDIVSERNIVPAGLPGTCYSREIVFYDPENGGWKTQQTALFSFLNNGDWYPGDIDRSVRPWICNLDTATLDTNLWTDGEPPFPVNPITLSFRPVPERTRVLISGRFSSDNISSGGDFTFACTVRNDAGEILEQVADWQDLHQLILYDDDDLDTSAGHLVDGSIEDNALDWDGRTPCPNRRYFRYFLPVYQTRIRRHMLQSSTRVIPKLN